MMGTGWLPSPGGAPELGAGLTTSNEWNYLTIFSTFVFLFLVCPVETRKARGSWEVHRGNRDRAWLLGLSCRRRLGGDTGWDACCGGLAGVPELGAPAVSNGSQLQCPEV